MKNYKELLKNINTFIFDYDGVLTDGTVLLSSSGELFRTSSVKDGYALQLAVRKGYRIAIITGGKSDSIVKRFKSLDIKDVFISVESKIDIFKKYIKKNNINKENILYMGDDIPDYQVMKEVAVPCCPADAAEEIKSISKFISDLKGGEGCVRDIIEQVLKVQGKWMNNEMYEWGI